MDDKKKNSKYKLPKALYNQVIWLLRDYNRLQEEAHYLLFSDGISYNKEVRSSRTDSEVEIKAMKREHALKTIKAIDIELSKIPAEYREGIWDNILYRKPYPPYADRTTYARHKSNFIYRVAEALFWV